MMIGLLAAISGQSLIVAVITLIVFGIIFWLLWWLVEYCNPREPFKKVANVILAILAVIVIINILLSLIGRAFIVW
jgi:hypothetical protein